MGYHIFCTFSLHSTTRHAAKNQGYRLALWISLAVKFLPPLTRLTLLNGYQQTIVPRCGTSFLDGGKRSRVSGERSPRQDSTRFRAALAARESLHGIGKFIARLSSAGSILSPLTRL